MPEASDQSGERGTLPLAGGKAGPREASARKIGRRLLAVMLAVHAALAAWGAARHSPNVMEAVDLPAGLSHLYFADFSLRAVNPPLVRTVAAVPVALAGPNSDWTHLGDEPASRPEYAVGHDFIAANGERVFRLFTLARWACLPFTLLGGIVCYRWARELYGVSAGLLAAALWCFDPTLLAHAQTMNADLPGAALGVAAGYVFWCWLRRPTGTLAAAAGLTLGLALLARTTLAVLAAAWVIVWLMQLPRITRRAMSALQMAWMGLVAVYVLNLGYSFEGSFRPLNEFSFVSSALGGPQAGRDAPANRFRGTWLGACPVPLPAHFVVGLDLQKYDFENADGRHKSYLRGEWSTHGWWYYYAYGLAVKWPLGTWGLLMLCLASCLTRRLAARPDSAREAVPPGEELLVVSAAAVFVLVSAQTGFSTHFRYVLPMFPFLFVWMARVAACSRVWRWGAALCVGAVVAASLAVYPHSLAYFNALAGGPRAGHRHLLSSSLDWGQDLLFLRDWLRDHPKAAGIALAAVGPTPHELIGVESGSPPPRRYEKDGMIAATGGPQPGYYAVSVTYLHEPAFEYFQAFEPVGTAGYSILIYHLTPDEVGAYRREAANPPKPAP